MISAKLTLALAFSPQHADRGERRVPYLARPQDYEAALTGLSPTVHVRVAHSAPLMCIPIGLYDFAALIQPGASVIVRGVVVVGVPLPGCVTSLGAPDQLDRSERFGPMSFASQAVTRPISEPQCLHFVAAGFKSSDRHAGQLLVGAGSPNTTLPCRAMTALYGSTITK